MFDKKKTLQKLRKKEGLTQIEAAESIEVTQSQISGIERGVRVLHLWAASKISPHVEEAHPHELFVNQNLYSAVKFLEEQEEKLEKLADQVDELPEFDSINSETGLQAIDLNSELLNLASDTRLWIKNLYTAFVDFWFSTGKWTGRERMNKVAERTQELIENSLDQVEKLDLNPNSVPLFRASIKPLSDEQIKNRIKKQKEK